MAGFPLPPLQLSTSANSAAPASSGYGGGFSTGSFVVGGGSASTSPASPAMLWAVGVGAALIAMAIYFGPRK